MEALPWSGKKVYNKVPMASLNLTTKFNAKPAHKDSPSVGDKIGEFKSAANFTFIRLHAGGHMVPLDQPEASLDMVNRWLAGEWLV